MKGGLLMSMISDEQETTTVTPADWITGPLQGFWTYGTYAALPDDGCRYEVVQGVLIMSPAPTPEHQSVLGEIYSYLRECIQLTGRGMVYMGPLDVELSEHNVFQPDVLVVLKEHADRFQGKHFVGAPDLAVEIISPSSATYDRLTKLGMYEQTGVPEYWLVNPKRRTVEVFVLEEWRYRSLGVFRGGQVLPSRLVSSGTVAVERFFAWM
jgi:Uma2 family endonuclease